MKDSLLFRILRNHLSPESVDRLREALVARPPEAYDRVLQEALKAAPRLEREVDRNRRKTELLCGEGIPIGRLRLLIENSSPPMLVALARQMMRESYDQRFDNPVIQ